MKRLLLLLLFALPCAAQVPVALSPVAKQQFFDSTGKPLAGGALFTFIAGTTTPQPTYSESTGTTPNANPVILDSGGFVSPGPLFLIGNGYKFVLCAAFTGVSGTGTCASFGPQQWVIDNILLPPFLGGNNIFTGNNTFSGSNTFNGTVTFNAGGSLNGTFTGSPTFSGTPIFTGGITVTGGTLTNSTLVTPTITSPTVTTTTIVPNLNPDRQSIVIPNNAGAGTVLNSLAKFTGAPSTATIPLVTDTVGAVGIVTANAGAVGNATIQNVGLVNCNFDAATTAGDYVSFSITVAGDCHDVPGGGFPSSGQVLGRVLSTNGGAGLYQMNLFASEDRSLTATMPFPTVVFTTALAPTNASITAQTMTTVGASSATFSFSWYADITTIGTSCTGSTLITPNVIFQDPNAVSSSTVPANGTGAQNVTNSSNGVLGPIYGVLNLVGNGDTGFIFRAKTGTAIQYSVTYTAGSGCSPAPTIQFFPILEQLTAN